MRLRIEVGNRSCSESRSYRDGDQCHGARHDERSRIGLAECDWRNGVLSRVWSEVIFAARNASAVCRRSRRCSRSRESDRVGRNVNKGSAKVLVHQAMPEVQEDLFEQAASMSVRPSIHRDARTASGSKQLATIKVINVNSETFLTFFSKEELYVDHTYSRQQRYSRSARADRGPRIGITMSYHRSNDEGRSDSVRHGSIRPTEIERS